MEIPIEFLINEKLTIGPEIRKTDFAWPIDYLVSLFLIPGRVGDNSLDRHAIAGAVIMISGMGVAFLGL